MNKIIFFLLLFLGVSYAKADFINLVQADSCETLVEIFIDDDHILARFEIGTNDYPSFSDIIPADFFEGGFTNDEKIARWDHFMQKQFVLQTGKSLLLGKVKLIEPRDRISRSKLATGQIDSTFLGKKIICVEIEYPLTKNISQLSISPPILPEDEDSQTNIGFVVYHKKVPVNDLRWLEKKETLHLNWEDPWYSVFENVNISRHHKSSFMSFLYVEPYEVRHEILGRIKDMEDWLDLRYGIDDMIGVKDQEYLKDQIAHFLEKRNIVRIDGKAQNPIIDKIHFVEINLMGIQIIENPKPIPYSSAIIGVIFAYPHEGIPGEVTVQWDMFNDKIQQVPATAIGPEGPWPFTLTPSDSLIKWKNFLKHYPLPTISEEKVAPAQFHIPLFTIVFFLMLIFLLFRNGWRLSGLSKWRKFFFVLYILLAILAYPIGYFVEIPFIEKRSYTKPEAKELISQLLKNTYRAFDFREEAAIYDKLALSNDVDLLQDIYLQTRKSMLIENQGGAEAKVKEVVVVDVEEQPKPSIGLAYRCKWIVIGEVGHWGHSHRRTNQYDAIISIKPVDGFWKMYQLDVIEEQRL